MVEVMTGVITAIAIAFLLGCFAVFSYTLFTE
jgi:hypothetical protein